MCGGTRKHESNSWVYTVSCARGLKFGHQIFRLFWFVRFSVGTKHFLSLKKIPWYLSIIRYFRPTIWNNDCCLQSHILTHITNRIYMSLYFIFYTKHKYGRFASILFMVGVLIKPAWKGCVPLSWGMHIANIPSPKVLKKFKRWFEVV